MYSLARPEGCYVADVAVDIAYAMLSALSQAGALCKVESFALFGSCLDRSNPNDYDLLLIAHLDANTDALETGEVIGVCRRRFRGDFSIPMPIDPYLPPIVLRAVRVFCEEANLAVSAGIGPANLRITDQPWIHLNGPMSAKMWSAFSVSFPIQSISILRNFHLMYGLEMREHGIDITQNAILQYCDDMSVRIDALGLNASYFRKIIQGYAVVLGAKSSRFHECIEYLEKCNRLTGESCVVAAGLERGALYDSDRLIPHAKALLANLRKEGETWSGSR